MGVGVGVQGLLGVRLMTLGVLGVRLMTLGLLGVLGVLGVLRLLRYGAGPGRGTGAGLDERSSAGLG